MPNLYFASLPLIKYNLSSDPNAKPDLIRNIFFRMKLLDAIRNQSDIYYDYGVKDGERPEDIAYKYYKDINLYWLVLYANNIVDPFYDWPLSYESFVNYMNSKYQYLGDGDGVDLAKAFTHHYELQTSSTDSNSGDITINSYQIDANTYANTAAFTLQEIVLPDNSVVTIETTTSEVSFFDYENDLNESKRNIKLIDKIYVNQIKSEFDRIIKYGQ